MRARKPKRTVAISDHAVLRYAERVLGFDVEAAKREIRERVGKQIDLAAAMGATRIVLDGVSYIIEDGVLITVIDGLSSDTHGRHRERNRRA